MRILLLLGFVVSAAGCNAAGTPSAPSQLANPIPNPPSGDSPRPGGPASVSGVVVERRPEGNRPVAGAAVNAWIKTSTFGYSHWWANGPTYSDSQGRYELRNLVFGAEFQLEVSKDGFVLQCAPAPFVIAHGQTSDAYLVAESRVSAARDSVPPSEPGFRIITGVVHHVIDGVQTPASSVGVQYEPNMDSRAAWMVTDTDGRFLLCGIPQDRAATLVAYVDGNGTYFQVSPGSDADVALEVKR